MPDFFLRRRPGHWQTHRSMQDDDLEKFYTNAEDARKIFEDLVKATHLPKHIVVIHGIGGVGKSTLLKMYALSCHRYRVPVALAPSEEAPSPVEVLAAWARDLNNAGITLPAFKRTLSSYRTIQAKVEEETKKGSQATIRIAGSVGKTVAKTAINMAASTIPIVGPLMGALGGESAEAFIDWLRGFLSKPDIELYLEPTKRLGNDFLSDLNRIASRQRVVLMTDTYEQMTTFDDWMRELARHMPGNVLLIIAGRLVPAWDRGWPNWMGKAEIVELKEMTSDDISTLVHRYYDYVRKGSPDPTQVEAIVRFARGLPMVATTVVQLWVKYGLEDFPAVRPQVVADLVDRLLEGVPQNTGPAFEAAAVLRYFNVETLGALLGKGQAEGLYAELRRWPFIRSRSEGLAVHDTMREMINEALYARAPKRFRRLHERAASFYEAQLQKATLEERERYALERLYHRVRADERSGIQMFQQIAEELANYRMANRLRALLNDINNYPLEHESSRLWREYYNARLAHLDGRVELAQEIYRQIGENERAEPKLQAYTLTDWGEILSFRARIRRTEVEKNAIHILESSLSVWGTIDAKVATSWIYLSIIYRANAEWEQALVCIENAIAFFTEHDDYAALMYALRYKRGLYGRQGNLRKSFDVEREMQRIYALAGKPPYMRMHIFTVWEWLWGGYLAEREKECRAILDVVKTFQYQEFLCDRTMDLAICLSLQGKVAEALATAEEGLTLARSLGNIGEEAETRGLTVYGIVCFKNEKVGEAKDYLSQAVDLGQKIFAHLDIPLLYLATVCEVLKQYKEAEQHYQPSYSEAHASGRHYYECGALTGLLRVKYAQNDCTGVPSLWTNAEQLAQKYEYNDHFTSLYLTRGHITWDGLIPEWESGFDAALRDYQLALLHALRFNRFLLDEALSGQELSSALQPIIPHCLEQGKEGQRMLIALKDWWLRGLNDIGTPWPDTISPIPEGIALLEAERIARSREPGVGSPQKSMVEQVDEALAIEDNAQE